MTNRHIIIIFSAIGACTVGMIALHLVTAGFDLERDITMVLSWVALFSALIVSVRRTHQISFG